MEWYIKVLKQYNDFKTRARRKEFWMFTLFSVIISSILTLIDNNLGTEVNTGTGLFGGIYSLLILVPTLAVSVRRLHYVGKCMDVVSSFNSFNRSHLVTDSFL